MEKFEYKFEVNLGDDGGTENTEEELNKLGNEGWELVAEYRVYCIGCVLCEK